MLVNLQFATQVFFAYENIQFANDILPKPNDCKCFYKFFTITILSKRNHTGHVFERKITIESRISAVFST